MRAPRYRGAMPDTDPADEALVARLDVIEEQTLASRAEAYAQVHAELQRRLEGDDGHAGA